MWCNVKCTLMFPNAATGCQEGEDVSVREEKKHLREYRGKERKDLGVKGGSDERVEET